MEILPVSTSNNTVVGLVDGETTPFQLGRIQGHMLILKAQRYIQGINQDLKKALNFKIHFLMSKYEYVSQDIRLQDGKDLKEKDLKISELKSKSKEKAQDQITKHEGTSLQQR
ncbi:hypothetical protein Tco_1291067 [Tanacetum coccineum]